MDQKVIRSKILIPELEASYRNEYTEYARRNLRFSDAGAAADDGEKCEREIYYDMTIPEKKSLLTSGTLVLFDDGRIHEADIRRRLRLLFDSPERELKDEEILLNGRPCSGKIDNTVKIAKIKDRIKEYFPNLTDLDFDCDPVVELKSVNEFVYQQMARDNQINQSYYDQVQMYLHETKKGIAIILIKNRNSSGDEKGALPFLEFIVISDPERQTQIRAGLKTTAECVEKKVLPRRPFLKASTKCSYCRFKLECWGEEIVSALQEPRTPEGEAPGQEILEAAVKVFNARSKEIKELEKQQEEARSVLERFFKATLKEELIVGNIIAKYSLTKSSSLDKIKLLELVGSQKYALMANPTKKLIEKAIADREIDAKVLEDITVSGDVSYRLLVSEKDMSSEREKAKQESTKTEGAQTNDKGNIRRKKTTPTRKNQARNKKGKSKRKNVSV